VPSPLPMVPVDRRCRPWSLDNPLRRRWAPAARELDLLEILSGQTVADLGTGVGFLLVDLLRRVGPEGRVWAIDPDPQNLQQARRRVGDHPSVQFRVGSAANLPEIPTGSVDRVVLSLVLCCMVDKEGALDETWRILRPGGRVYVSYPKVSFSLTRRRPSLRVTPERWSSLAQAHPWDVLPVRGSWAVTRHLLARPHPAEVRPTEEDAPPGVRMTPQAPEVWPRG
jgi:SAM-dependent methyltransferase